MPAAQGREYQWSYQFSNAENTDRNWIVYFTLS